MSNYTPGPWNWDEEIKWVNCPGEQEIHTGNYDIYDNDETIIAGVNGHIADGKANAQLIATAPELLEALEKMIFAYKNKDADFPHQFEIKALELAKLAIVKARGEV